MKKPQHLIQDALRRIGVHVGRVSPPVEYPKDLPPEDVRIMRLVKPYTMTSLERQHALIQAVRYVVRAGIPGSIAECGVWRGGSMMAVAHTLLEAGETGRDLYLYDTYEGMSRPADVDVNLDGYAASVNFERYRTGEDRSDWCMAGLEDVRKNLLGTGYPAERLHFVKGKVEDTLPGQAPASLALLRLDTDWYESTRHELVHLFPRLATGGVLVVDDYGHWQGCRRAVDEYFAQAAVPALMHRVDYTGRVLVKR